MPRTTDRTPGPSRGAFCTCGFEYPPIPSSTNDLDVARHWAHHYRWDLAHRVRPTPREITAERDALRHLVDLLEALVRRLRVDIRDLQDQVARLEDDVLDAIDQNREAT